MDNILGGGSSKPSQVVTQKTDTAPWQPQQPHLERIFGEAENLYDSEIPQYFPGQTVVPFSPETETALTQTSARAMMGNPLVPQAQQYASDTLGGEYLSGSPFFEGAFNAQVAPMVQQYSNVVAPNINSQFAAGGRLSGNSRTSAQRDAANLFADALSREAGKLAFQNYGAERQMQQAMSQQAPAFAQLDYLDPQQLAGVGAAREAQAQAQLAGDIDRFNFEQQMPATKLAQYMGLVGGGFGSQSSTTQPIFRQPGAQFLGGGLMGLSAGKTMGLSGGPLALAGLGGGLLGLG